MHGAYNVKLVTLLNYGVQRTHLENIYNARYVQSRHECGRALSFYVTFLLKTHYLLLPMYTLPMHINENESVDI